MKIAKIMTRDVKTCLPGDTLEGAARIMWDHDCGVVPVVDGGGRLVGILTDRDVCMAAYFQGRPLSHIAVDTTMCRKVVTCREDDEIEIAERRMQDHQIRRLPVTTPDGRLVGILSLNDIVIEVAHRLQGKGKTSGDGASGVARVLAAVCAHREPKEELVATP